MWTIHTAASGGRHGCSLTAEPNWGLEQKVLPDIISHTVYTSTGAAPPPLWLSCCFGKWWLVSGFGWKCHKKWQLALSELFTYGINHVETWEKKPTYMNDCCQQVTQSFILAFGAYDMPMNGQITFSNTLKANQDYTANVYRVLQGLYRCVPVQIQVLKVYWHSL